jgi:predicted transcriptional regulator of viral defense system
MRTTALSSIESLYFGYEEVAQALGIGVPSARVAATRYVRAGLLLRLKRNTYVLRSRWEHLAPKERFLLANAGQTPSYISFMTALDHHGLTSQIQRGVIESAAVKRTREMALNGWVFRYTRLSPQLYFGFQRIEGLFIAEPEKALLDACYLTAIGRYALDLHALEWDRFDRAKLDGMARKFPARARKMMEPWIS